MRKYQIISIFLMAFFALTTSCQKQEEVTVNGNNNISMIEDQILITDLIDDVLDDVELTSDYLFGEMKAGFDDCRKVTIEPKDRLIWPKTITIDFGPEGCTVREGIIKKGKIIIVMSGRQNAESWEKVVTFDSYFVNDNQIEGTHTISFHVRSGHPVWTTTITGGRVTNADGVLRTREATRIRFQTRGLETLRDRTDDAFQLTGNARGINRNGKTFEWTITEPLVASNNCRWIRKGIKEINLEGQNTILLDFGNGECDNLASLTQDGITKEITLKGFRKR